MSTVIALHIMQWHYAHVCSPNLSSTVFFCCQILRATGRPYHPHCFTCVVCGKSLDGIPFTVDATSQIHCIEDFHKWVLYPGPNLPQKSLTLKPILGIEKTITVAKAINILKRWNPRRELTFQGSQRQTPNRQSSRYLANMHPSHWCPTCGRGFHARHIGLTSHLWIHRPIP